MSQSTIEPTDPREIAARTLARTASPRRAARRAGISIETMREWQRDTEFQQLVTEVHTASTMKTLVALQNAAPIAAKVLVEELQTEKPKTVRRGRPPKNEAFTTEVKSKASTEVDPRKVRAAKIILEHFLEVTQSMVLVQRIVQLEELLSRRPGGSSPVDVQVIPQLVESPE